MVLLYVVNVMQTKDVIRELRSKIHLGPCPAVVDHAAHLGPVCGGIPGCHTTITHLLNNKKAARTKQSRKTACTQGKYSLK